MSIRAAGDPLSQTALASKSTERRPPISKPASHNPELVLLDLGLPDGDGLVFLRALREWSKVPVVVLSARGKEEDKIGALDGGADDYLTKPFGVGELLARMRVALRHAARELAQSTRSKVGQPLPLMARPGAPVAAGGHHGHGH